MKRVALGIDVGSLFVKLAVIEAPVATSEDAASSSRPEVIARFYRAHHGNPQAALRAGLEQLRELDAPAAVVGTGAALVEGAAGLSKVDLAAASVRAVRALFPDARNIIDVGGGSVTMITVDQAGRFQGYAENSLCAAGTGSFLDEQAARMEIDYDDLKRFGSVTDPPTIATRCAVFAKSDLIHRQQEGYTKEQMWSGLCRGLTSTMLQTLLKGKPLNGQTVLVGGVAQNAEVLRWLKLLANAEVVTFADAHLAGAIGAAMLALDQDLAPVNAGALSEATQPREGQGRACGPRNAPLELVKTRYPSFDVAEVYCHRPETGEHIAAATAPTLDDTEVRISAWEDGQDVRVTLGIDIGSTSTKAVLVDEQGAVVADLYRKTAGDPVAATKKLFTAITDLAAHRHATVTVLGCGTTGSGRKLVGEVVGADGIINEISAHVAGAMSVDPTIETIFEIGGQDSKYMRTSGGRIADAAMNYVCAAGTGSFVEEQAKKLGFPLDAVGEVVMGIAPPLTSDRCTVFMEQDVHHLIRKGFSPAEAMAGVLYSVIQNYLTKVVGNRPVSRDKVFFQGATARNRGLVAAIEKHLGVEVVVSPYCHVMGAYGVALLVRDLVAEKPTRFRGLDLAARAVKLTKETCNLCDNYCTITSAEVEGEAGTASFGYMCGRDPAEKKQKLAPGFDLFRLRDRLMREAGKGGPAVPEGAPVVGLPRALSNYTYLPLWRRFFAELGLKTVTSRETSDETKHRSSQICGAEFCFPAKLAHGHVAELVQREGVDFVLVPHMISVERNPHSSNSHFCPYVQSLPSYLRSAFGLNGISAARLLSPVVDFRQGEWRQVESLFEALGGPLGRTRRELRDAWRTAKAAQIEFGRRCAEEGERRLGALKAEGKRAIVALGRPYNTFDQGANLGLPQKIADLGHTVIPIDFLAFAPEDLGAQFKNLYWHYGQRIIAAARRIAQDESLNAIFFTNFNCGPDSFLLTYAQHLMAEKPMLILELDEHGGDAGYLTRVEAFLDVLRSRAVRRVTPPVQTTDPVDFHQRTIWIPPMHPLSTSFFAAAMRAYGYDAHALPTESREAFDLGRRHTRGTECLPTAATIGGFLTKIRALGLDPARQALFMPTAEGPCRFGQYATLHRMILDREDCRGTAILSPASYNSYQGLEEPLRKYLWKALLAGDIIYKAVCKVRPYERELGATDHVARLAVARVGQALQHRVDVRPALRAALAEIAGVPQDRRGKKPLVGVVGEIYVRCNLFSNEDVVRAIEHAGGEAWLAPISEWILYTSYTEKRQALRGVSHLPNPVSIGMSLLKNRFLAAEEHEFYELAGELLADRHEPPMEEIMREGGRFVPEAFEGETIITIGRAIMFARRGAAMVVNCAPFGCMPGTITTGIFQQIQEQERVPMVNMFYDGGGNLNRRIGVYLANLVRKRGTQPTVHLPVVPSPRAERRPATDPPRVEG